MPAFRAVEYDYTHPGGLVWQMDIPAGTQVGDAVLVFAASQRSYIYPTGPNMLGLSYVNGEEMESFPPPFVVNRVRQSMPGAYERKIFMSSFRHNGGDTEINMTWGPTLAGTAGTRFVALSYSGVEQVVTGDWGVSGTGSAPSNTASIDAVTGGHETGLWISMIGFRYNDDVSSPSTGTWRTSGAPNGDRPQVAECSVGDTSPSISWSSGETEDDVGWGHAWFQLSPEEYVEPETEVEQGGTVTQGSTLLTPGGLACTSADTAAVDMVPQDYVFPASISDPFPWLTDNEAPKEGDVWTVYDDDRVTQNVGCANGEFLVRNLLWENQQSKSEGAAVWILGCCPDKAPVEAADFAVTQRPLPSRVHRVDVEAEQTAGFTDNMWCRRGNQIESDEQTVVIRRPKKRRAREL